MLVASVSVHAADLYYVRSSSSGDGRSWETASGNLQDMIDAAFDSGGGTVWVAEGTYYPSCFLPGHTGPREKSFILKKGVKLFGGFPGSGAPEATDRDPKTYESILSGDLGEPGDQSDNAIHIVYMGGENSSISDTEINGFLIKDGSTYTDFSDNLSPDIRGGGMLVQNSSISIEKCRFVGNSALLAGGLGFVVDENYHEALSVRDCSFYQNTGQFEAGGAGMSVGSQSTEEISCSATASFSNCTFSNNSVSNSGAGLACGIGAMGATLDLTVTNCTFIANQAYSYGGGIIVHGRNSVLGAAHPATSNAVITNSTFTDNHAYLGSGISVTAWDFSVVNSLIVNSIVWGNVNNSGGSSDGNEIYISGGASADIRNSVVRNALTNEGILGGMEYVSQVDVSYRNPLLDPEGLKSNGGFCETIAISKCSAAINRGLPTGLYLFEVGGSDLESDVLATDQNGYERNEEPDSGSFEYQGDTICHRCLQFLQLLLSE